MYQTTVKCRSLRLAEKFKNLRCDEGKGVAIPTAEEIIEYTEASLEGTNNETHFFFNFPVNILDENMRIGDEILVTFERKNK